jgi:hypothetical protein
MKENKYFENDPCNNSNNKNGCKLSLPGVNEILSNYVVIEKEQNNYTTIYVCKKVEKIKGNNCFID